MSLESLIHQLETTNQTSTVPPIVTSTSFEDQEMFQEMLLEAWNTSEALTYEVWDVFPIANDQWGNQPSTLSVRRYNETWFLVSDEEADVELWHTCHVKDWDMRLPTARN